MLQTRRQFLRASSGLAAWGSIDVALGFAAQRADHNDVVTGESDRRLSPYDELMTSFMREHRPPGAALAVAKDSRLVYARGFGYADVEKNEPVQPSSLFRIASVSKPITATACFRLIEKRRLSLDAKVFELLGYRPHLAPGTKLRPTAHGSNGSPVSAAHGRLGPRQIGRSHE